MFSEETVRLIAGPCAVESRDQLMRTAEAVADAGLEVLRGGAFKPRTSPYTFQGLGEEGLEILAEARERYSLRIVTELTEAEHIPVLMSHVDVIQIGARNMDNYALLRRVGEATASDKRWVILKRGFAATVEELLLAAEYILAAGNPNVALCERGIRTFEHATRFSLDLNAVPLLKKLSTLPVLVDTSHGTGHADMVVPMSRAAVAAGADGLMIEAHPDPKKALCDGAQSLAIDEIAGWVSAVRRIAHVLDKDIV